MVRRHLIDKVPVSDLADNRICSPSQVIEEAEQPFQKPRKGRQQAEPREDRLVRQLHEKPATKNEVSSELLEENVKAKKADGEV